jgi:hypothetical protein
MNYIKHLNGFLLKVACDFELNPTHISLYLALFKAWNQNQFKNPISITRDELMPISKIASKSTYLKTLKELEEKGYIKYQPSFNPFKGSLVYLLDFEGYSNKKADKLLVPRAVQNTVSSPTAPYTASIETNIVKDITTNNSKNRANLEGFLVPDLQEVIEYFKSKESSTREAEKFFNYYTIKNWLLGNQKPMTNWNLAANHWMANSIKFYRNTAAETNPQPNHLQTNNKKNYDEPL